MASGSWACLMKRAFFGLAVAFCLISFDKLGLSPQVAKDWRRFSELESELERGRNLILKSERERDYLISFQQTNEAVDATIGDRRFKAALRELREVGWAKASVQSRLSANSYVKAHPKSWNYLMVALELANMRIRKDEATRLIGGFRERDAQLTAAKAVLDSKLRWRWLLWGIAGAVFLWTLFMAGWGLRRYVQESNCGAGELLRACFSSRLLLALGPALAAAFVAASLLIGIRPGEGSFPWLSGAGIVASIAALVWAAVRLPDWALAVFATDGPSWSSDFRVLPLARRAGISLYFLSAGGLCFVMSLALTTFVAMSSPGQCLLVVSALAAAFLALFCLLGRGRGDGARGLQLVILAVIAGAAVAGTHRVWHGRVDALKREWKAKGHPVTRADFQEERADGQYANPALQDALIKLDKDGLYMHSLHPGEQLGVWTEATLKFESKVVAPYRPRLTKEIYPILERRRYLEKIDFVQEAAKPYATHAPKYYPFIGTTRILSLGSVVRARSGDRQGAWDDLRHAADLSDLAAPGPTLIGRMIAVANRKLIAQAGINIALNARAPLPEDLADRLRRSLSDRLVVGGLGYEAARRLDLGRYFEGCRWAECEPSSDLTEAWFHPILGRAMGLSDMFALREASKFHIEDSWPNWAQMRADCETLSKEEVVVPYFETSRSLFVPGLFKQEWAARVWTQLALLSSAAVKFRAKAGRFPRALGELSPEFIAPTLLRDPFSGREFAFKRDPGAGGFELSSVGPEGNGLDSRGMRMAVKF